MAVPESHRSWRVG